MYSYSIKPNAIDIHYRPDGIAEVFLHKNITEKIVSYPYTDDNGEEQEIQQTVWEADEVQLVGNYNRTFVEENFDELWNQNTATGVTIEDLSRTMENVLALLAELM